MSDATPGRSTDATPPGSPGDAVRVQLPPAALFARRAARLRMLAPRDPLGDTLQQMALVCDAQHQELGARSAPSLPPARLARRLAERAVPYPATEGARDPQWRADLHALLHALRPVAADSVARALDTLARIDNAGLEALADRLVAAQSTDSDAAAVPFVGAALQLYTTRLARTLAPADLDGSDAGTTCPVCAMRPVAGVLQDGGADPGTRLLHCALCATEWPMSGSGCSLCRGTRGISYLSLPNEAAPAATGVPPDAGNRASGPVTVSAECCDDCRTYLKLIDRSGDPLADPVADDLASLALDVMVGGRGYARSGPNLLFYRGGA